MAVWYLACYIKLDRELEFIESSVLKNYFIQTHEIEPMGNET